MPDLTPTLRRRVGFLFLTVVRRGRRLALAACGLLATCTDSPTELRRAREQAVVNAAPPPLAPVAWLDPLGTASADPTTFDAAASPVVDVCQWNGTSCVGASIAQFATVPTGPM